MTKDGQHIANSTGTSEDLFERLRQISDALWDATQRGSLPEVNALLDKRQTLLDEIASAIPLSDGARREVMAILAADKYLARQLNGELTLLDKRLRGISQRQEAAAGYRSIGAKKSYLSRRG